MTYQTIETLTLGLVRAAKGNEVSLNLPTGAAYTV